MQKLHLITVGLLGLLTACEGNEDTCGADYARADDGNCYPINTDGETEEDDVSQDGTNTAGGTAGNQDTGAPSGGDTDGATDGGATDEGATGDGTTGDGATDGGTADGGATDAGATDGGTTDGGPTDDPDFDEGPPDDAPPDDPGDEGMPGDGFDEGLPDEGAPDEGSGEFDMDGGATGDTGDIFDITDACDGPFPGTTALGSVREWMTGGSPITFESAAWRWNGRMDTATVLITQEADTCSETVIAAITEGTYEGPAASIEISNWATPELDTLEVTPPDPASDSPSVKASAYYFDTDAGSAWPLDGFTGPPTTPTYGTVSINYIELGGNFEARANLYGGPPGEGVDGNFNACYCDALSALDMPSADIGGGDGGPPPEDPPEEGEAPPLGDGADPDGGLGGSAE